MDSTAQRATFEQMAARLADLEHQLAAVRDAQSAQRGAGPRWRARLARAGLVAVAGLLVLGGVASASIPDPSGAIHACYVNYGTSPHYVRVIDTATTTSCASYETMRRR